MDFVAAITELNKLTVPGAIGLAALSFGAVGIAFAIVWLWRSL